MNLSRWLLKNCKIRNTSAKLEKQEESYIFRNEYSSEGECFNWDILHGKPNCQTIINEGSGYTFAAQGDYSYNELQVYINDRIISPEPKVKINLLPGQEFKWSTNYLIEDYPL